MIGCIAKAASDELHPDLDEMEDVRWVKRDAVRQALQESESSDSPFHGEPTQPCAWGPIIGHACQSESLSLRLES